ncbi:hypothetical protein [Malacoplasma muris]
MEKKKMNVIINHDGKNLNLSVHDNDSNIELSISDKTLEALEALDKKFDK